MRVLTFILITIIFSSAQASFVSYEAIDAFHKSKVQSVSLEYSLDKRVQISYSLLPLKKTKTTKNKIIKLPGLLLDSVSLYPSKKEVGLFEIIEALDDYKRKIVILKSSRISDKEVEVVKQALMDELFIKDQKAFEVKPWAINQIWYNDLKSSFQNKVLTSPYTYFGIIVFAVVTFLLFSLSSSILNGFKHVGKSIYDSVEKSMSNNSLDSAAESSAQVGADLAQLGDGRAGSAFAEGSDQVGEIREKSIDCHAILGLLSKTLALKPNELRFHLWELFPTVQHQLSLYIAFETELSSEKMEMFSSLFNSVFQIESGGEGSGKTSGGLNVQSSLWQLRLVLTHLIVKPLDPHRERIFGLFSENYSGQVRAIVEGSLANHFKVLSYVFEEQVNNRISSLDEFDDDFSSQILSYVTLEEGFKVPSDLDVKNFEQHLKSNKFFLGDSNEKKSAKDFALLSKLPDRMLFAEGSVDKERMAVLNSSIPNFKWIDLLKTKAHKGFILSLTPDEATHFMNHFVNFEAFKEALDGRTASRLQELRLKSKSPESVKAIVGLRNKISRFYTAPVLEKADELQTAA